MRDARVLPPEGTACSRPTTSAAVRGRVRGVVSAVVEQVRVRRVSAFTEDRQMQRVSMAGPARVADRAGRGASTSFAP